MAHPVPEDQLIGHRMAVDNEFSSRVIDSQFSHGEWDVIMSTVTFEIDRPDTPEEATLQPTLDDLDAAIAATEEMPSIDSFGALSEPADASTSLLDRLRSVLGGGGHSTDREGRRADAQALIEQYAEVLEIHLKQRSAWTKVCRATAESSG